MHLDTIYEHFREHFFKKDALQGEKKAHFSAHLRNHLRPNCTKRGTHLGYAWWGICTREQAGKRH